VYASLLLLLYFAIVPETAPGRWSALSVRAVFALCAEVLLRRVNGSLVPLKYALSIAFASSLLMNFVTNSSVVYLEYFGVTPSVFPWFFALSVLGFMALNLFSMRNLEAENAARLFRFGLRMQLVVVAVLVAVVLLGMISLWTIVPLMVLTIATLGLIAPAGAATYMSHFKKLSGSAASAYTTLMFAFGGLFGALTGAFYDGSLLPLVVTMAIASIAANLIGATIKAPIDLSTA